MQTVQNYSMLLFSLKVLQAALFDAHLLVPVLDASLIFASKVFQVPEIIVINQK